MTGGIVRTTELQAIHVGIKKDTNSGLSDDGKAKSHPRKKPTKTYVGASCSKAHPIIRFKLSSFVDFLCSAINKAITSF